MTTMNETPRLTLLCTALLSAGLLAGCASRGPHPTLEMARNEVNNVAASAEVSKRAPLEIKAAQDTIARADHIWREDHDETEVVHLAYLAQQRAEIARYTARSRLADEQISDVKREAERLQLEARTREADARRREAEQARQAAAEQERSAALARSQAQQAQLDAQAAARSAEAQRAQALAAQQRVRALEAQLRELEGKQTERGLLVTLGDVLFAFNRSELLPQAGPRLDKLAQFLKDYPERRLLVEGHTDSIGSDSYNLDLSRRRADAVREALAMRGVERTRIVTQGYGKAYPVADNSSPEGRALNRRVEVVIADEKGTLRGRS